MDKMRRLDVNISGNQPWEHEPLLLQITCQGLLAHLKLLLEATKDIERCEKEDKKVLKVENVKRKIRKLL